jgi:predicted nucleic acid-binding Zn ribbon protein
MGDEKRILCNHCGEKILEDDKFCQNCGENFNRNNKTELLIVGIIGLIAILALLVGILSSTQDVVSFTEDNLFSNVVEVGGISFNIPKGYVLNGTDYKNIGAENGVNLEGTKLFTSDYVKNSSVISMIVTPNSIQSLTDAKTTFIQDGWIIQDTTIGGYAGFETSSSVGYAFVFEKNDALIIVLVTPDLKEDIGKIIN